MPTFKQNSTTTRFIAVYNELLNNEIVNSQTEFCDRIVYKNTSFNAVLKGKRNIPLSAINGLCREFNIDRDSILDGTKPVNIEHAQAEKPVSVDSSSEVENLKKEVVNLKMQIEVLKEKLEDKEKIIKLQDRWLEDGNIKPEPAPEKAAKKRANTP